jgi:TM2 domain-containing membrane protein YozV
VGIPVSLYPVFAKLPTDAQMLVKHAYDRREKSILVAYIAWFFIGWHYLYLRRVGLQIAFWLSCGGFFVWWFVDLFRIPGMVSRLNEDTARELMVQYKTLNS